MIARNMKLAGDCIPKMLDIIKDSPGKIPNIANMNAKQSQYKASSCFTLFFLIFRKIQTAVTNDAIRSNTLNVVLIKPNPLVPIEKMKY